MEGKTETREEIIPIGFTLVRNSEKPLSKVIILGKSYTYHKDQALYTRSEISGLTEQTPVVDYKLGGLEQIFPKLNDFSFRIVSAEEVILIREAIKANTSENFKSRKYLFEDYLPLLHGNLPNSVKEKYKER